MTIEDQTQPPPNETPDIFLSYSRGDQALAIPIIAALEAAGFSVWWDGLLEAGSVYTLTTERALEEAAAVVVLWSAASVGSHWVRDEATIGRDERRMVPISIDGTKPPLGFRQFQSIDLSGWSGDADAAEFRNIVKVIEQLTGTASALRRPDARRLRTPTSPARRRALAIGGTGAVAAIVGVGIWQSGLIGSAGDGKGRSIAILPFANLSGEPDQAYFSDGLSEELRAVLSNSNALQVAAQTSSNMFRDDRGDAKKIADTLDVDYLLDGSVRRSGDQVRVSAQLIDGKTGFDRWSQSYDRNLKDIFAVQSDIAGRVAAALAIEIPTGGAQGKSRTGGTLDPVAYDAYLHGVALYQLGADENTDRAALSQFKAAIAADPGYAAAWAGKSRVETAIANSYPSSVALSVQYDTAIASAKKAVALAPRLAAAHAALGYVLFNGRLDAKAAEPPYRKAFVYGRGNADILQGYATFMARIGQFADSRMAIDLAMRLDPLNPTTYRTKGMLEYLARDYPAARVAFERALTLNPEMGAAHSNIGQIDYIEGHYTAALAQFAAEKRALSRLEGLAMTLPRTGDRAGGQARLAELEKQFGENALYQEARVLAQWGDTTRAIDALERARKAGDSGLVQARNDPLLAPLREDPRFAVLVTSMGFTLPS